MNRNMCNDIYMLGNVSDYDAYIVTLSYPFVVDSGSSNSPVGCMQRQMLAQGSPTECRSVHTLVLWVAGLVVMTP